MMLYSAITRKALGAERVVDAINAHKAALGHAPIRATLRTLTAQLPLCSSLFRREACVDAVDPITIQIAIVRFTRVRYLRKYVWSLLQSRLVENGVKLVNVDVALAVLAEIVVKAEEALEAHTLANGRLAMVARNARVA